MIDKGALLHAVVALALVVAVGLLGDYVGLWYVKWIGLAVNSAGWPLREAWQGYRAGRINPWDFSAHRKREAFWPVVAGFVAVGVAVIIN